MAEVTLHVPGKGVARLALDPETSILKAAIARDLIVRFGCKSGRCGRCRMRVLGGSARLSPPNLNELFRLGEQGLAQGYRLACQTHVLEGHVEVRQE